MFMNPPEDGFTIEETLKSGSRHTMFRKDAGVSYVTTIELYRFEPEPPLYEVQSAAFREATAGEREYLRGEGRRFENLDEALTWAADIQAQPVS